MGDNLLSTMAGQQNGCVPRSLNQRKLKKTKMDDRRLAQEMNELSVQEREKIYDEIHGVNPTLEETPEMIEESLKKLQTALSEVSRSQRKAYDRAVFLRPALENDTKFQLMFLRADRHDAILSASRMCQYFTDKLELFGDDKLAKEITLEDMDKDDMESFHAGSVQLLERKDQSGRRVVFAGHKFNRHKHWKNAIRYAWYLTLTSVEDEEAQLSGIVLVLYCMDMKNMETLCTDMVTKGGPMLSNLPFRANGVHFCYNDSWIRPVMELIQIAAGKQMRLRFRIHFGSHQEVMYALLSFGIPMKDFPMFIDGTLNLEYNRRFLQKRKELEAATKAEAESSGVILYPRPRDVLLGRGRPFQQYHGNLMWAVLVDDNRRRYSKVKLRLEKRTICSELVNSIHNSGGRFLQRTDGGWTQVSDEVAREKVSHGFRTQTKRQLQMESASSLTRYANGSASNFNGAVGAQESNKRVRYDDQINAHAVDLLPHEK